MSKVTIQVFDECNCKIVGLDSNLRRTLNQRFKYEVPGAYHIPSVKLGRWDGKIAFFQMGGKTFINLLPDIIPVIQQAGYEIDIDDKRQYSVNSLKFEKVDERSYSHKSWPEGHPVAGEPIILRDYQVEIINSFLDNEQGVQEVATGSGKTLITAILSHKCENIGRTIVVVPNKSLVTQTEEDYINLGLDVGVLYADRKEFDKTHTICTWQSLNNLTKKSFQEKNNITLGEFMDGVVAVICDECHQAKADILKTVLTESMGKVPLRWGLTGTIPKDDLAGASILSSIGPLLNRVSASDLQDKGVLAKCNVNVLQLIDIKEFSNYQSELKYLLTNPSRQDYLAKFINNVSESGNTLVLIDRVSAGKELVDKINTLNVDKTLDNGELIATFISGKTNQTERKQHYDEIKTSTNKIICATYGVAAVGINIPRIFNLVLLEPGKSFVRVIQSIGRGIRKSKDKDFVQIWDITSTCKFAKRHLTERKKFYREANYPFTIQKIDWD